MSVVVYRGAETSNTWSGEGRFKGFGCSSDKLHVNLAIPVSSGESDIRVTIDSNMFSSILELMMSSNEGLTIKAIANVLRDKAAEVLDVHRVLVCLSCGKENDVEVWPEQEGVNEEKCNYCGSGNLVTSDEFYGINT